LVVYFIQNIWVFDMISSYMLFFLSLACVSFLISPREDEVTLASPQAVPKTNPLYTSIGALLIVITILTLYFGNIQPAQASRYTLRGLILPSEEAIPAFQKALLVSPISQFETPEQLSIKMNELLFKEIKDAELFSQELRFVEEEIKKTINKNPNFRLYLFLGRFYNNVYQFAGDKEKLNLAIKALEKATELSPKNQQVYWSLGQTLFFQARFQEAIEFFKKAVDLEPRFGVSHWYLGSAYKIIGNYELAFAEYKEAEKFGYNFKNNLSDLKKVIEVYQVFEDHAGLVPLYESAVELEPKDVMLWSNLADVYAAIGEREKAKMAAEKVLELSPDKAEQIQEFLRDLGY